MRYQDGDHQSNILIRDVPEDDLARIDAHAARLGISRNEYLQRRLHQDARRVSTTVTMEDLAEFGELSADLLDETVMRDAWS